MAVGQPRARRGGVCALLLAAAAAVTAFAAVVTATAAAPGGGYAYPRSCPRPPAPAVPSERGPLLDAPALRRFLDANYTVPGGEAVGFPPGVRLACGDTLPRTGHVIQCAPGWPVGGVVLVPTVKRAVTASVVFMHGLVGAPHLYLLALSALLQGDPRWWSTVRVVMPVAPAYEEFLKPLPNETFYPGTGYAWYDPSGTDAVLSAADLQTLPTKEALAKALTSGQSEDVAGLAATAVRITAVACAEAAVVCGGGGGGGCHRRPPPVVVLGDVRGGTAALGVAALAPRGLPPAWAGVVSVFGGVPLVPYVGRHGRRAVSAAPASSTAVVMVGPGGPSPTVEEAEAAVAVAFWARLYGQRAVRRVTVNVGSHPEVFLRPAGQARVVATLRKLLGEGAGVSAVGGGRGGGSA